jgi:hypothetical protein
MQTAFAVVLGFSTSLFATGCFETEPVGTEGPPDSGKTDSGSECTGTNPGCCNTVCNDEEVPAATCKDGAWTCPADTTLGPACPAICRESDAGNDAPKTGASCSKSSECTGSEQCFFPIGSCAAKGTCMNFTSNCNAIVMLCGCDGSQVSSGCITPTGYATGPTTGSSFCIGDAGSTDSGLPCCTAGEGWGGLPTTNSPTCEGCCSGLIQSSSVVGPGDIAYTCAAPTGAGDGGTCSGTAPECCGLNAEGCEGPVATATCDSATAQWVCPSGDTATEGCAMYCLSKDAGVMGDAGSCETPIPSCCVPAPLCATLAAGPTCSDGTWSCPAGTTKTVGECPCGTDDGGVHPGISNG